MSSNSRSKVLKTVGNQLPSGRLGKRVVKDSVKEETISKRNKASVEDSEIKTKSNSVTNHCESLPQNRLDDSFFDVPCIDLAKRLLGKILVRRHASGSLMKGRIVETECYAGGDDKASCSYGGKQTPKNKPTFMKPGTAFVYMTYGMYHCINLSSHGDGAAVLLRALEPVEGIEQILENRQNFSNRKTPDKIRAFKPTELCNGPSKLCIGFNIDKNTVNEKDVCVWNEMWVEHDARNSSDIDEDHIVKSKRVGIDFIGEPWASKPLRFYIYDSLFVSKRDKKAEEAVKKC